MPDTKGITINSNNLALWVMIATIVVGSIVDSALTRATVARHDKILNEHNVAVMNEQMENMAEDMKEIKTLLTEFMREYNKHE